MSSTVASEEHLIDFIDRNQERLVWFVERLIASPSPNPPGDERLVAATIQEEMEALGFKDVEVISKDERRPNIIFRASGEKGLPVLIYNGHTDTKPPGDMEKWETDPFTPTIRHGRLYGLGACDMKGSVAATVYAAAAVNSLPQRLRGDLVLALTADEEAGGEYGAQYVVEEYGLRGDCALVCELSGMSKDWEYLHLLSRGFSGFRVKVYGTQMHSSISDLVPSVNAVTKMAHVLCRLEHDLKVRFSPHPLCPQGVTVNLGVMVKGGIYYGVYPGYAEFGVDVRTLPGMTQEGLREDVEKVLEQLRREDPSLQVELEFEPPPLGWNEGTEISADHPLVRKVLVAAETVLGFRPALHAFPGGTDAGAFQGRGGIPTIPAFGPGLLPQAHLPNEYIRVESIIEASKVYALTALYFLCNAA